MSCNLPFTFLSCPVFRNLVHNLNPNLKITTLNDKIKEYSNKITAQAKNHINFQSNEPLSIIIDGWKSQDKKKMLNIMIKPSFNRHIFYKSVNITFDNINTNELSHIIDRSLSVFDSSRFIGFTSDYAPVMKALASSLYTSNLLNVHQFGCVCHTFNLLFEEMLNKRAEIKLIHEQILCLTSEIDHQM